MFPAIPTSEWESKILADLKGKDYTKALVWKTPEGIPVKPYYRSEELERLSYLNRLPGEFPFVRGNAAENHWRIRQDIQVEDPVAANKKALSLLMKGVDSLGFELACVTAPDSNYIHRLLEGINPEAAEINLYCKCKECDYSTLLKEYFLTTGQKSDKIIASVAVDPLAQWLLTGHIAGGSLQDAMSRMGTSMLSVEEMPGIRTIAVHGVIYGNSGAHVVQELAFSLAHAVAYMDFLTEMGHSAATVASRIKFNLSIGNNYFLEIAKLRAARLLWAQLMNAYKVEGNASEMMIHSETAQFNKTLYDAHTNLLRTQTEAMSAALGGAHSISVLPFDFLRGSTDFSERIARNQQILLKEESHFDKVSDPAGGAYFLESLTASIAEEVWNLFLKTEESGGFIAAVKEGFVQNEIGKTAQQRMLNLAIRRENLVGVNQFPDFGEVIGDTLNEALFFRPTDGKDSEEVAVLLPFRGAAALEELRYTTDRYAAKNRRPTAFMLTIGNLTMRKARAQFACNFFAVGGFEVIDNNGFESPAEGVAAARSANADIIVVCSSDEEYAALVPEINALLGREILVVAGNPECRKELEASGVHNFIHVRSNLIEELSRLQQTILIP